MSDMEIKSIYKAGYHKLLGQLENVALKKPALYDDFAEEIAKYRAWVINMADIEGLPEVPKK